MNFFEHQDKAKRQTRRLIGLFCLAVIVVAFSTALVISGVFTYFIGHQTSSVQFVDSRFWHTLFTNPAFGWSILATLTIIILGSAFKTMQLGGNGIQVALSMDAKHVHPETTDPKHKQFLNIVTEMALASGNPVPKVFVLPGNGINAFAAGYNRHQTVVAATEGALQQLTRDELQGVVAHEFSHINFGDVKINMRLVALLHGILIIGIIGQHMLGSSSYRRSYNRKSNSKSAGIGLALMAIGYGGTFFGKLIKAAVSRQREFLADASAVQFTRNPDGIAKALSKIAKGPDEISIESENAEQFSHFYFSSLRPHFLNNLFATHPDIHERITRLGHKIDFGTDSPSAFGHSKSNDAIKGFAGNAANNAATGNSATNDSATGRQPTPKMTAAQAGNAIVDIIGQPTLNNLNNAKNNIAKLPPILVDATHNAFSARALIYGLIIEKTDKAYHQNQLNYLRENAHPQTLKTLHNIQPSIALLNSGDSHNLLLMSESALQDQSPPQAQKFQQCAKALIEADKQLTLNEWCIYRLAIAPFKTQLAGNKSLKDCKEALGTLFYYAATYTPADQRVAVLKIVEQLLGVTIAPPNSVSLKKLDAALTSLSQLKPLSKPALLKALVACIKGDGVISDEEIAILRMVALVLDCPIPDIRIN